MTKPAKFTANEASRLATFRAATAGMRGYQIANKLNKNNNPSETDYRGCTKGELADSFAKGWLSGMSGARLREAMNY